MGLWESVVNLVRDCFSWLRGKSERRSQNLSQHARQLLLETDRVQSICHAMQRLASDPHGIGPLRQQASALWTASSTSILLAQWHAHAWVLDRRRRGRRLRKHFGDAIDSARQAAVRWHDADVAWRKSENLTEGESKVGGPADQPLSAEAIAKSTAADAYLKAYDDVLKISQELHGYLEPLL